MPKKDKVKSAAKTVTKAAKVVAKPKAAKAVKPSVAKAVKVVKAIAKPEKIGKPKKIEKPKKVKKTGKAKKGEQGFAPLVMTERAQVVSSEVVFKGPLFRICHDKIVEPGGHKNERDVIRHNGSVVIMAMDNSKGNKKNPWIVMERQYRHAANQFLWELPAGKLDPGEDAVAGAKRELAEETGYSAKKWSPLVEYFASPGFLGESMKVFLAEGLMVGEAHPEADEKIEFRLVRLSEILKMIDKGAILDGKTLTSILLYVRKTGGKRAK
jgi:ADP-ribose pyrophosphatase